MVWINIFKPLFSFLWAASLFNLSSIDNFFLRIFWERWESNLGRASLEASMLTIVPCCPPFCSVCCLWLHFCTWIIYLGLKFHLSHFKFEVLMRCFPFFYSVISTILSTLQIEGFDVKALRAFRVLRPLRLVSGVPSKDPSLLSVY